MIPNTVRDFPSIILASARHIGLSLTSDEIVELAAVARAEPTCGQAIDRIEEFFESRARAL
jgi:hypothetical protein